MSLSSVTGDLYGPYHQRSAKPGTAKAESAGKHAFRAETAPAELPNKPGMSAKDATPETRKTALDGLAPNQAHNQSSKTGQAHERAEEGRKSRALARRQPRGDQEGTHRQQIRENRRQANSQQSNSVVKNGDQLSVRKLDEFPMQRVIGLSNGAVMFFRFRGAPAT